MRTNIMKYTNAWDGDRVLSRGLVAEAERAAKTFFQQYHWLLARYNIPRLVRSFAVINMNLVWELRSGRFGIIGPDSIAELNVV